MIDERRERGRERRRDEEDEGRGREEDESGGINIQRGILSWPADQECSHPAGVPITHLGLVTQCYLQLKKVLVIWSIELCIYIYMGIKQEEKRINITIINTYEGEKLAG